MGGLAETFCAKATVDDASGELETLLSSTLEAARAEWPRVTLADDVFVEHLATHASASPPVLAFLRGVHAGDLYLACAVARHDRAALAAFEERFMARVPEYVLRVRIPPDAVDEVKQKLRERLVMGEAGARPKIAEYSGKGALGGWLRVTAVRTALNHVRGKAATTEEVGEELSVAGDPELAFLKERATDLFRDAFRRVLDGLDANERSILRLHYIEGLTMDQLAQLYKMPRSTVARRVASAREQILRATETLLREERRLSPSAVASVIRDAQSRLDVTITRLLRE